MQRYERKTTGFLRVFSFSNVSNKKVDVSKALFFCIVLENKKNTYEDKHNHNLLENMIQN